MTIKNYVLGKMPGNRVEIRDREIVLRELSSRGYPEDSEANLEDEDFNATWDSIQRDLKGMYDDGLLK